jgi:hypothetical protein
LLNETDRPDQGGANAPAMARRTCVSALLAAALVLPLGLPIAARAAESVSVTSAHLDVRDDPEPALYLNAQFAFDPSAAIEDAIRRGIPMYFVIDFELVRTRWYWFDKRLASAVLTYRLSYSPLTRQFRLSRGALAQPFETLDEALATIRTVRDWKVGPPEVARSPEHLVARVRLRLDTTMLPKPFQVDTLTNRDWALASNWAPVTIAADVPH